VDAIVRGHPMYINIAVHYMRPKQSAFVREAFQSIIREVINSDDLDLEANPIAVRLPLAIPGYTFFNFTQIHRSRVELEEMRAGAPSHQPKDVTFQEAIHNADTRAIYIRR
jgi:Ras GTPase-activating-like protein IQGAP2/3